MIPFEFVVEGVPVSLQTKNSQAKFNWKQKVLNEAIGLWKQGDLPSTDKLQVTIIYFYDTIATIDVDNMLKPIIDALISLIYVDDNQITDVIGRKRKIGEYIVPNLSPLLTKSLKKSLDFVYVQIELAPKP